MPKSMPERVGDQGRSQIDVDSLYQDLIAPGRWVVMRHSHVWRPPTDVFETDDQVIVRVEAAGMREGDFHVSFSERKLIVTGVRRDPYPKVSYHQMEIHYGEFRTEVYLHWAIETDAIDATYTDGFLQVTLPKSQARRVQIVETNSA